jgi:hypothetical protein
MPRYGNEKTIARWASGWNTPSLPGKVFGTKEALLKQLAQQPMEKDPIEPKMDFSIYWKNVAYFAKSLGDGGGNPMTVGKLAAHWFLNSGAEMSGIETKSEMGKQPWFGRWLSRMDFFLNDILRSTKFSTISADSSRPGQSPEEQKESQVQKFMAGAQETIWEWK